MRMRKLGYLIIAAVLVSFVAGPAFAESAKSGAALSSLMLIPETTETHSWDDILSTTISVPEQKELVFDVAVQCGLYTDTLVKSKGGTKDTSTAEAAVKIRVEVQEIDQDGNPVGEPFYAGPGEGGIEANGVTYCKRAQTLSATLQGIIENLSCFVDGVFNPDAAGCVLTDEEIELVLDTLNANAFNFVSPNLSSGTYKVTAQAEISSSTDVQNGSASAMGLVGLGSMIVDQVRFVQSY